MGIQNKIKDFVFDSEIVKSEVESKAELLAKDLVEKERKQWEKEAEKKMNEKIANMQNGIVEEVKDSLLQVQKEKRESQTFIAKSRYLSKNRKGVAGNGYNSQGQTAKEQFRGTNQKLLWTMFSNAPGSVQCANRVKEAVIGGGYVIEEDKNKKGKKSDLKALIEFFDNPNPEETIEAIIEAGIESYLAYGNWYFEKVPSKGSLANGDFRLKEIYNLNSSEMSILVDAKKKEKGILEKVGYKRNVEGKNIIYTLDEIGHVKRTSASAGLYGRGVLETNDLMLSLLIRAMTYNVSVLRNGGRPPIQIILPEDTTEADAESVNAFYEANYTGEHDAGKALVLFKGAKAEALGITPQDMAYLDLINIGIKLVSGQYGVPLLLIGFPEGANRASASEARRAFYYSVVYPLRKFISKRINDEIIKKGLGIEGWKFGFRQLGLEESESTRRDTMAGMQMGAYTWNEGRAKLGALPLEDEWANKALVMGTKRDAAVPLEDIITDKMPEDSPDGKEPAKGGLNQGEGADETPEGTSDE